MTESKSKNPVSSNDESKDISNDNNMLLRQYWWLNVEVKIWNLNAATNGSINSLPLDSFSQKSKGKVDKQFFDWISRYLIDREDNPHFGIPISYREFAISYLDYYHTPVNKKALNHVYSLIRKNLDEYLKTTDIICNPPVVLSASSYSDRGKPQRAAWQYPINEKDSSIKTDKHGNRLPRILNNKDQCNCLYFYRKSDIPTHPYVKGNVDASKRHIGDKSYVQPAPKVDIEINFPIIDIQPLSYATPIKEGDVVIGCIGKKIVAFLDVKSVSNENVELRVSNKLPLSFPINSLKKSNCDYRPEKELGFFPITDIAFNRIFKIIDDFLSYSKDNLLKEVFIDESTIDRIVRALNYKKNIILQGVPGVGKTYLAKRLAYAMMNYKDDSRVCVVQFHPNYTYEDFIIGYRPCDDGTFKLKPGLFLEFCKMAETEEDKKYFIIIDEINRGNLNKIFGEAFTLIDKDHRKESIKLANSDEEYCEFDIPENVYIIGLMNTADRSLAMLDYALLRRFEFITLEPAFRTKAFEKYRDNMKSELFNKVIDCVIALNESIKKAPSLGGEFCIGHSYFCISKKNNKQEYEDCLKNIETWLKNVIDYEIIPLLKAYCFDDEKTFKELSTPLLNIFDDNR